MVCDTTFHLVLIVMALLEGSRVLLVVILTLTYCIAVTASSQAGCNSCGGVQGKWMDNRGCCQFCTWKNNVKQSTTEDGLVLSIRRNLYLSVLKPSNSIDDSNSSDDIFDENLVVGMCRYCSLYKDHRNFATSKFITIYENDTLLNYCEDNAKGSFCNRCKDTYYHNIGTSCVKCDRLTRDWVLYLLSQFPMITIMFAVLFLTNFSLVSGPLNASIFFAQMVSTTMDLDQDEFPLVNITNSSTTAYGLTAVYKFIYSPLNLNFFSPFINKLCLFHTQSYLYYFIMEYVVAFYPLLLVSIVSLFYFLNDRNTTIVEKLKAKLYCCYRLVPINFHQSTRNVLASFVYLSYMKFAWVSTLLVTPNLLYDYKGDIARIVLYFDVDIAYFGGDHVAFAAVGVICLLFLLLLPTVLLFLRYKNVPRYFSFLKTVLEPFQHPFPVADIQEVSVTQIGKLGRILSYLRRSDYQWIPSVYFLLRIFLLVIFLSVKDIVLRFTLQQIVCFIGALVFIFLRPYPKEWNNKLDSFVFLMLGFINTLSMYQFWRASQSEPLSLIIFVIQYIMIFIPFIWMTAYIIHYFRKHCKCVKGRIVLTHSGYYDNSGILMTQSSSRPDGSRSFQAVQKEYNTFSEQKNET